MDILLVGAGGYGTLYVDALLQSKDPDIHWVGVIDPCLGTVPRRAEILAAGIPAYPSLEDFYREHTADLVCIATPPFLHREQCLCALAHGSHVLCEKPAAPTPKQVEEMIAAEKTYGRFIAIGFQWSFSDAIQALKRDVLAGKLGKPLLFKTAISWPRNRAYYARGGGWGGKAVFKGMPLYDSIASNACAHYLHNMLFLMGDRMETAAMPAILRGDFAALRRISRPDIPLRRRPSHPFFL